MPPIALFNQAELEAAFRLMLPPEVAASTADRWFNEIAGEVDANGYFLYEDWHEKVGLSPGHPDALMVQTRHVSDEERRARERAYWATQSVEDLVEWLMRFSGLHFALVALVSEELFERMRLAEGLTLEQAERSRVQMRNIVAAIGRAR